MMGHLNIKTIRVGIDASNLRLGGGVTHLVELLRAVQPQALGIDRIVVWGGKKTLSLLEDRSWLDKHNPLALNRGLLRRMLWQRFFLAQAARKEKCDILFVPGGSYAGDFHPVVTMSRNLLPFQWRELRRYGWTLVTLKMIALGWIQAKSFRCVDGLIFLNQYAKSIVLNVTGLLPCESIVIPHGMHNRFKNPPRNQKFLDQYSLGNPYQIIYVSTIDVHKHQWHVAEAIAILRNEGYPLAINFIGPSYPKALKRLQATQAKLDPGGDFIVYTGPVPHAALNEHYASADLCLFASSCENMPNILLEGMASGLPIACSKLGPMREILGDAGCYFDPENPEDIAATLRKMAKSPELRAEKARAAYDLVRQYSWDRCAYETFSFLKTKIL